MVRSLSTAGQHQPLAAAAPSRGEGSSVLQRRLIEALGCDAPYVGFWKDHELTGVELVVFEPRHFVAVRTAVEISVAIRDLFPHAISVANVAGLDRDWGTDSFRQALLAGKSADAILAQWTPAVTDFQAMRKRYLLY
ncbi:MAG: hypothetical protein WB757_08120 [Candidatus Cybelea sp.]